MERPRPPLFLASASPRRCEILLGLGVIFSVESPAVDEVHWDDRPRATVRENAYRKCEWCRARHPEALVIAADTVVVFESLCIAKPDSREQATAFLQRFSGKPQTVFTGVALYGPGHGTTVSVTESSVVFRRLTAGAIQRYFAKVDPMDKAGAYDINQHGDEIIASHDGSWSNIMGLPRSVVADWLRSVGMDVEI